MYVLLSGSKFIKIYDLVFCICNAPLQGHLALKPSFLDAAGWNLSHETRYLQCFVVILWPSKEI